MDGEIGWVGGFLRAGGEYKISRSSGVATETAKSVLPSSVCWWRLSLFMWVAAERYSSAELGAAARCS